MSERHPTKILPLVDHLRESLDYNPETGELRWKIRPRGHFALERVWKKWNTQFAGKLAGTAVNGGYYYIAFKDRNYLKHRIIWKIATGEEPPPFIDHKDRNRANNQWKNLRAATVAEQAHNRRRPKKLGPPNYRGVQQRSPNSWQAAIRVNGVTYELGSFRTCEEASAAYEEAARKLQGEFYLQITPSNSRS